MRSFRPSSATTTFGRRNDPGDGMIWATAALAAACVAAACVPSAQSIPPTHSIATAEPGSDRERPREAVATHDLLTAMDAQRMASIAAGDPPLRELVDPAAGVIYIRYATDSSGEDPLADADGKIKIGERWCGAALDAGMTRLEADLRRRVEDPIQQPLFECEDLRCSHPAQMEYDVRGDYEMTRDSDGDLVLTAVEHVEAAGMTEEFRTQAQHFIRDQRAAMAGGGCSPP